MPRLLSASSLPRTPAGKNVRICAAGRSGSPAGGKKPVCDEEQAPGGPYGCEQAGQPREDGTGADDPAGDQYGVGHRAHRDDETHMLTGQTLPQHEGVLRADDDDQGEPEAESGARGRQRRGPWHGSTV